MKIYEFEVEKIYTITRNNTTRKYKINEIRKLYIQNDYDEWLESNYKYNELIKLNFTEFDTTAEYFAEREINENQIFYILNGALTCGYDYIVNVTNGNLPKNIAKRKIEIFKTKEEAKAKVKELGW